MRLEIADAGRPRPTTQRPVVPQLRFLELGATAKGALLSLQVPNVPTRFGLRGAFGDEHREPAAFIALSARKDGTLSAEISSAPRAFGSRGNWFLDHGTDWILRVSPEAWEAQPNMPRSEDSGWLIAMDGEEGLSLLVPNQKNPYVLDLRTWTLRPFLGRAYVKATRWDIALTAPTSTVDWSLPARPR